MRPLQRKAHCDIRHGISLCSDATDAWNRLRSSVVLFVVLILFISEEIAFIESQLNDQCVHSAPGR